jgi:5-methyltetrahydrofolate--homocysteine methyltransferase
MPIDFNAERWARVHDNARRWWAGKLDRPLIQFRLGGRDPGRPAPKLARVAKDITAYDLSVSAADIVDRWDYELSQELYLGDAFPQVWVDFGPGVVAAFMGAEAEPGHDTVWFHPAREQEISTLRFDYRPGNVWLERVKAISRAAVERWGGRVQVGMTDLGGNLDILASFRPGEQLLLDLHDHPGEVKRLLWQAHELWWRYFDELNAALRPGNPGYTAWAPIFSADPYYMLQCDFCYMISPAMFDEFVKPELAMSCRRLTNAFYHLDGPGQLAHLDSLLEIPTLKGVQWVPGAGQPDVTHWPEVYRKIRRAGKLIQVYGGVETLTALADQLGSAEGIVLLGWAKPSDRDDVEALLRHYGVD